MSPQADYVVSNGTGAAVRSDINGQLAAIVSNNSGASAPATTYAYMLWADTSTNLLKLRNGANSAWITVGDLTAANLGLASLASPTFTGTVTIPTATISTGAGIPLGSAASPTIYFTGDTNTGIYSPGADQFAITTGGSGRVFVDSSGRVGLGTSSPGYKLDVSGTARTTGILFNSDDSILSTQGTISKHSTVGLTQKGVTASVFDWSVYSAGGTAIIANPTGTAKTSFSGGEVYFTGGNVGIGTTSPNRQLEVATAGTAYIRAADTTNSVNMEMLAASSGGWIGTQTNHSLNFQTNNTERARIDTSGRLLVGTSSASTAGTSKLLQVVDSGGAAIGLGRTSATSIGANEFLGGIDWLGAGLTPSAQIWCYTDAAQSSTSDLPSRLVFSVTADGASSPTERMRLHSSGTFTLWGTNNNYQIHISGNGSRYVDHDVSSSEGDGFTYIRYLQAGSVRGSVTRSSTGVNFNNTSDYRAKENVIPLAGATDRIKKLKPSRFNFIEAPDVTVDGFIAHEAQAVVPEAVVGTKDEVDADGNPIYQGIDQSKLVPLLTAALQEALAEIESLKARVTALEP